MIFKSKKTIAYAKEEVARLEAEDKPIPADLLADSKIMRPDLSHLELLTCGHQNNLKLEGKKSGVCPKGCEDAEVARTEED